MKGLVGLLPWAVVLAVIAVAAWLLVDRAPGVGGWLLALVILAHGLIHLLYVVPQPAPAAGGTGPRWPFDLGGSWVAPRFGLEPGRVRQVAIGLIALTVAAAGLAALATVGLLVPTSWWPALVIAAALGSLALLVIAFDRQLVLGIGIDIGLLWLVVAGWRPPG